MKAGIAGAGIMGRLLAFALLNAGWHVTIFDKGEKTNCSTAAAGLLTPVAELEKNDLLIYQLGLEAIKQHWPNILQQLPDNIYFKQMGSLVLSHPRDQVDLIRFVDVISSKLPSNFHNQPLNADTIKQLEPDISKFQHAYHFQDEAQIDSQALLIALKNYLIQRKIAWRTNSHVTDTHPGKITVENEVYKFDIVFDCRGLGAKNVFKDLRSIRGELIWLYAPDVFITRPIRFLHPRYNLYIVPRPKQIYLIGASEIEAEDFTSVSVRTALELLTAAYYVHHNFAEARIIKTVSHCRPTLNNHLPKIKYRDGFVAVNGLYRHGFLLAPTLVSEIIHWVTTSSTQYPHIWEKYTC